MTLEPSITVVLPTRQRADVLAHSLRTLSAQKYKNLRIIVSDNCSTDETSAVVNSIRDDRIEYVTTKNRVSMTLNWEHALKHVQGGWVTFMGDDDGLLPGAVQRVAEIIKLTGCLAIRTSFCTYVWPRDADEWGGELVVPMGSGLRLRNAAEWQEKVLLGTARYAELPMVYNGGFIHKSVFDVIKEKTGSFFRSVTPDVYSAIAISSVVKNYIRCNEPLAISGTSRHSTGNSFFSTEKDADARPREMFASESNLPFHSDLPLYDDGTYPRSLDICVYEAYLQSCALRKFDVNVTHARQLEVILCGAGKHQIKIDEWGARFADRHGLDFKKIKRSSEVRRRLLWPRLKGRKLLAVLNAIVVEKSPVTDIYGATVAAAVIRAKIGRADTANFLWHRLSKLFGTF